MESIQVNFNRPLPVFPLANVVLLPHSIQQLHIFEDRYRQMVAEALDGPGQIALATYVTDGDVPPGATSIRSAACVGQIIQHHQFENGRFNILLLGVCRALVEDVIEPGSERLYRLAKLRPLEVGEPDIELEELREQIEALVKRPRLANLRGMHKITALVEREDVPTPALIELIGSAFLEDFERRYTMLAEPSVAARAGLVHDELKSLDRIVRQAQWQMSGEWPKGMSWN